MSALPKHTISLAGHDDLPTGGTKLSSKRLPSDVEVVVMTPAEWAAVPGIDVQRDTDKHAAKIEPLLQRFISPHREVQAAKLPDGSMVKLNGHSRSLLWQQGRAPAPDTLIVTVHAVDGIEGARALYAVYDNAGSVETVTDKVFGACRRLGIDFHSSYCKDMRFSAALGAITPSSLQDKGERIEFWRKELLALDALDVKRSTFINPVTSIFLLTVRRHGDAALVFWRAFNERAGTKTDAGYDAIEALTQWLENKKKEGWGNGTSQKHIRNVVLGAYETWSRSSDARLPTPKALEKKAVDLSLYLKRAFPGGMPVSLAVVGAA